MAWFRNLFDWRTETLIRGSDGTAADVTSDGKLKTETSVTVNSVTATDVTIKDATNPANKQTVNSDGSTNVKVTGSKVTQAPVTGAKTVSTTAAEIFAGVSRLTNRYAMKIYNESTVPIYWGPSTVTTANGDTLLPGDSITITFDTATATAIYCIAASSAAVRVVELK